MKKLFFLLAYLGVVALAFAQESPKTNQGKHEFGVVLYQFRSLSAGVYTSTSPDAYGWLSQDWSVANGLQYTYVLNNLGFRAQLSYIRTNSEQQPKPKEACCDQIDFNGTYKGTLTAVGMEYRVNLGQISLAPFVDLAYQYGQQEGIEYGGATGDEALMENTIHSLGLLPGLGVNYAIRPNLSVFGETSVIFERYQSAGYTSWPLGETQYPIEAQGLAKNLQPNVAVGLRLQL